MRARLLSLILAGCAGGHVPEGSAPRVDPDPTPTPGPDAGALAAQVAGLRGREDASSQWQLALALAELRAIEGACPHGATLDAILDALESAISADPSLAARLAAEPALAEVRTTVRAQLLLGADLSDAATLDRVLREASWYGPPSGALPHTGTLDLTADGAAAGTTRALGDAGATDTPFTATWTAVPGRPGVDLTVDGRTVPYALTPAGVLTASGGGWLNVPAECGA